MTLSLAKDSITGDILNQRQRGRRLGAVFGLAGGFGEAGTSAEASGGLGFGSSFDEAAGNVFDFAVGTIAAAAATVLGP